MTSASSLKIASSSCICFRLAQIIILMFSLAIFFSYALQFYVPIEIVQPWFNRKFPHNKFLVNYGLRYMVVLITCKYDLSLLPCQIEIIFPFSLVALAAAIPRLDLFISLVGAASSSTLALIAPPLIDTLTNWPDPGIYKSRFVLIVCIT